MIDFLLNVLVAWIMFGVVGVIITFVKCNNYMKMRYCCTLHSQVLRRAKLDLGYDYNPLAVSAGITLGYLTGVMQGVLAFANSMDTESLKHKCDNLFKASK